jgi:hypothetical protein
MEERFDFLDQWPEWRRDRFANFQRVQALGAQLWGSPEHLKRQLELPSPEIPPSATKEDLLALELRARMMVSDGHSSLFRMPIIVAGDGQFSFAEACHEIVRRALAALGN